MQTYFKQRMLLSKDQNSKYLAFLALGAVHQWRHFWLTKYAEPPPRISFWLTPSPSPKVTSFMDSALSLSLHQNEWENGQGALKTS